MKHPNEPHQTSHADKTEIAVNLWHNYPNWASQFPPFLQCGHPKAQITTATWRRRDEETGAFYA